jgi:hypothetical protein
MITLAELEKRVVNTAVYALCGSASITAGCRADAATLVLVWAYASGKTEFDPEEVEAKTEEAYQYFEFGESHPEWGPRPEWAIWDWPQASASPSV